METAVQKIQMIDNDRIVVAAGGRQWAYHVPLCDNCGTRCRWAFPGLHRMRMKCDCGWEHIQESEFYEQ